MRIRLTTSVLAPWAVQDSTGSVADIDLHPSDYARLQEAASDIAEFHLQYQPPAIYVQLDNARTLQNLARASSSDTLVPHVALHTAWTQQVLKNRANTATNHA